jgi:hypothetical protein
MKHNITTESPQEYCTARGLSLDDFDMGGYSRNYRTPEYTPMTAGDMERRHMIAAICNFTENAKMYDCANAKGEKINMYEVTQQGITLRPKNRQLTPLLNLFTLEELFQEEPAPKMQPKDYDEELIEV